MAELVLKRTSDFAAPTPAVSEEMNDDLRLVGAQEHARFGHVVVVGGPGLSRTTRSLHAVHRIAFPQAALYAPPASRIVLSYSCSGVLPGTAVLASSRSSSDSAKALAAMTSTADARIQRDVLFDLIFIRLLRNS